MITADQYLERVRAAAKCIEDGFFTIDSKVTTLAIHWDIARGMSNLEAKRDLLELPDNHPSLLKIPGWALFFEMNEAKAAINDHQLMDSWVYDRATGVVVLNLNRGAHESFTACLHELYTPAQLDFRSFTKSEEAAEQFVEEGMGFVLSSRASKPLKGKNVFLTAQEKMVFAGQNFRTI